MYINYENSTISFYNISEQKICLSKNLAIFQIKQK